MIGKHVTNYECACGVRMHELRMVGGNELRMRLRRTNARITNGGG